MFGNPSDKTPNPQNNNTTPSLFGSVPSGQQNKPAGTSLFGNTGAGLFGSTTPSGGLFSNATSTLKTSERQEGGLFGSSTGPKPASNSEAPKLMFGGIGGNPAPNSLFGGSSTQNANKKQQSGNTPSLFSKPAGTLFQASTTPAPSLFGSTSTPANPTKPNAPKQTPQGGLFSGVTQQKKQPQQTSQTPTSGLFGSNTATSLFGNTPNPVFGQKKQGGGLFGNKTGDSGLFSNNAQSSGLFGGSTKTKEQNKQGNLLQKNFKPQKLPQQRPQFTLTGGLNPTPSFAGSGGLFGGKQTTIDSKPEAEVLQKVQKAESKPNFGLFGNQDAAKQKEETKKIPTLSTTGTSGLFGATDKGQSKPAPSGLFGNTNKQTPPPLGGSLFPSATQQAKPKQTSVTGMSLFGNTTTTNKDEPKVTSPLFPTSQIRAPETTGNAKSNQNLLTTFSKGNENSSENLASNTTDNAQRRTNRTISFNQNANQPTQTPNTQTSTTKPTIATGLFTTQQKPSTPPSTKPLLTQSPSSNITQSFTKPTTQPDIPPSVSTSNPPKNPKLPQQSFFKTQLSSTTKQPPAPTIFTAYQINNLLKEEMSSKKSLTASSRYTSGQKLQKSFLKNIEEWIEASFSRFNQVPSTEMLERKFPLHHNEDINRFLNDVVREVVLVANLPIDEKSFKLVNKLFFELLDKLGIKEYLFSCTKVDITNQSDPTLPASLQIIQLNTSYFLKHQIYKFTPQGIHLNLDSEQLQKYILALAKKFITNQLQYLEYIQNKIQLLRMPSQLFYQLLTYCLKYKKVRLAAANVWKDKCGEIVELVQEFQRKIVAKIVGVLEGFVETAFSDYLLINKQMLENFIGLVEDFSYTEEEAIIHISLKVILNNLGMGSSNTSNKIQTQLNPKLIGFIKETRSLQLLPFRTLVSIVENKSYRASPSAHDLYRYTSGPEWLDWLEIYLGNNSNEKEISMHQARYMIKILKYPIVRAKRINRQKITPKQARYIQSIETKVLNRKRPIYKYIISLKEQNMLSIFYEILMSIIYDYESYRKIEELFFRQKDEFNYEFRNVIAEICNYPTQRFKEEIPFIEEKVLYFLRIVEVAPARTLDLQKLVFEGTPLPNISQKKTLKEENTQTLDLKNKLQSAEAGHKICHLIIDTINYFGLKNNQKIVSKCVSAVKSLLESEQTSLPMKIAMAVNKPEMLFISNSLLTPNQYRLIQSLIVEMTQLLEYMLISEQFPRTMALGLYTNNSEEAHLQKMYSVRYSSKDYLPFARQIIRNNNSSTQLSRTPESNNTEVIITYSSYWILKTLQVLVQGFKQEKTTSSSYGKNLLYILSLVLEKFFIPISHRIECQNMTTKMMEESYEPLNNPIYSKSATNQIPKVLLYLVQALNTIDIMPILSQNLKYKLLKSGRVFQPKTFTKSIKYSLVNQKLEDDYAQNEFIVHLSVRILKQTLQVYRTYEQYKNAPIRKSQDNKLETGESHFVYKLLTRFKWIQELEFHLFLKGFSKTDLIEQENNATTNLIIGLVTLLMVDSKSQNKPDAQVDDVYEGSPMNLKQHNYEKPYIVPIDSSSTVNKKSSTQLTNFSQVENFYTHFGASLNFESINNFLVTPTNLYLESYESLECLVVQSLALMISGQSLFGARACNTVVQSTINIAKYIGFQNNMDISSDIFSDMWLLESFETQLYLLLSPRNSSLQVKQAILDLLYQIIKNERGSNNFIVAKKIFYKYLIKHLDQSAYYSQEEVNRLNVLVIKILSLLEDKDYYIMHQQCNDRFLDALIGAMLKNCERCLKSPSNFLKLVKSFTSKVYYPAQFAYYHLERTYEEREIIKVGEAYEILKFAIQLVEKKFFDIQATREGIQQTYRWKSIRKINSLIIGLDLPYIGATINDSKVSQISIKHIHQEETNRYYFNTSLPHIFASNPYEMYLTQAKTLSYIDVAFDAYKQNVIDWLSFTSLRLGQRILKFLNWTLTVDKSLYGNQPIPVKSRQLQSNKSESILCSMHMGNYKHNAVEFFAQSQNEAVNMIKTLFDQSLRNLEKGMSVYQERCFSIMGYCLEWIRARQNTQDILEHLVKNTIRNLFWIDQNTIKNHNVIKFILSLVSIGGQTLDSNEFRNIRGPILDAIHKFKDGKSQLEESLIQQLISILISIPPQLQDSLAISQIVNIWKSETNNEFFYNQSRLILEMCDRHPNEIAKLKALRSCEKIKKAVSASHYSYNLRFPDSIAFIWGLKIASSLMSSEMETVLIFEEVSEFFNLKSEQIYSLFLRNTSTISLVHVEELQAALQFILTLVSSQSWVTVHRKEFQKLTYVLSHKLINLFMDFINSKITFMAESDMEKRFKKIRFESYIDQIKDRTQNQAYESNIDKNSVFRMLIELKMVECIKTFTLVLSRCFELSWYVHKYFNQEVYENFRYGVSFWDRVNKSVMDLVRFNVNMEKKWRKTENLNQKLLLVQDCINSSEFFVETGYLSSLSAVPLNSRQLFDEFDQLNRFSLELGTIHLIQEKTFRQKYQCLMKGNIQKFGKKLIENVKIIQDQSQLQQKAQKQRSKQKKQSYFQNIAKNVANLIKSV